MTGFGGTALQFKAAKAFESLQDIPNIANLASPDMRDPEGFWVGHQMTQWCITYNTQMFKSDDLPKTWDDLVGNPKWGSGHIGLGNRPQLWLFALWGAKGKDWGRDYTRKLFVDLKPQLRKEGINAVISLVALGEVQAALPASGYRTLLMAEKGAPISFYCPAPVPVSVNEIARLRGSPSPNAARIFINWLLSKEGQVVQFHTDHGSPVHKALSNDPRFLNYAEMLKGKPLAFRAPEMLEEYGPDVIDLWNGYWSGK
jgi:ABC-type Fe3+ transport system substrate-binding protein